MKNRVLFIVVFLAILMIVSPLTAMLDNISPVQHVSQGSTASTTPVYIPHKGISSASLGLFSGAVNPYAFYSSEAAPMGIADYGVGTNGNPYYYNTYAFLGQVQLNSLSVSGSSGASMSFQMNVNLQFSLNNGNSYTYWIQDVAFVDTSANPTSGYVQFIDNVWNSSSVGSQMAGSSIAGNGTVSSSSGTGFYYDWASVLPGNDVTLNYPAEIQMEVISYTAYYNGNYVPAVAFMYNDGYGWQTYDNVYFTFATNTAFDSGFVVNGYNYNPAGLFDDAELIMGGPGGGSTTSDLGSSVNLSLEYYNGFNFQQITSAYDFGSDTAETISNVYDTAYYYGQSTGQIFESITAGSGNLNNSYVNSEVSWMLIVSDIYDGYLYINNNNVTQFFYGYVNVTLGPGTYTFSLLDTQTGLFTSIGTMTLLAGEGQTYIQNADMVNFTSSGLPAGSLWSVTLNNVTESSTGSTITFYTIPGENYNYTVSTPAEYKTMYGTGSGSFVGVTTELVLYIYWTPIVYYFNFTESGLPSGALWSVTVNHTSQSSSGGMLHFQVDAGNTSFKISNIQGYSVYPNSGDIYLWTNLTLQVFFVPNTNNAGNVSSTILLQNGKSINGEYFSYTPTSYYPLQDAYDPVNGYLYVASALNSNITIINTQNNQIIRNIALSQKYIPEYLVFDSLNDLLYASTPTGTIVMISTQSSTVLGTVNIGTGQFISYLSMDQQNGNILVSSGGNLTIMSQNGYIENHIYTGPSSYILASEYIPSSNDIAIVYYNQYGQTVITTYGAQSLSETNSQILQGNPYVTSMLYDGFNHGLYIFTYSNIFELNTNTLSVEQTILTSGASYWGVIDPFTQDIYVLVSTNSIYDSYTNISLINPSTGTIVDNFPLPFGGLFSAYDPSSQSIYVTDPFTNSVYVFQPEHYYSVNLTLKDLPSGTRWYVNVTGGPSYSSISDYISFYEPDGTYTYSVSTVNKTWEPGSSLNQFNVKGASQTISVNWKEVLYTVTFSESGLLSGQNWYVIVDGKNVSASSGTNITILLPNGTYQYTVGSVNGYTLTSGNGTVSISGAGRVETPSYSRIQPVPSSGLPPDTMMYAAIAGVLVIGSIGGIIFVRKRK